MADEKKLTSEELTDEEANAAAGGYVRPTVTTKERDMCYLCNKVKLVDEMMYAFVDGQKRHVCCKCMGVR